MKLLQKINSYLNGRIHLIILPKHEEVKILSKKEVKASQ